MAENRKKRCLKSQDKGPFEWLVEVGLVMSLMSMCMYLVCTHLDVSSTLDVL